MRLNEWQLALEAYLLGDQLAPAAALQASLSGSPSLSVEQGLQIYHNAYRARLLEVLREDFPAVHEWLGDAQFEQLASAYLKAHPSRHYSLRWLGERFAGFLEQHLQAGQQAALVELAELEWRFTLAFDAADAPPLSLEQVAGLAPQAWPALQVQLLPCVQRLPLHYNSLALWQATKKATAFPASELLPEAKLCLIWRQDLRSQYRSLGSAEAAALLGMCDEGWNFARLCEQLASSHAEDAPRLAAGWLKQWLSEGLLQQRQG